MPISKINTTSITDNSVTAGKIVAGAVDADIAAGSIDTAQIADDAVTSAKISNDIAINTSGAITTTGAFTSQGIDDNSNATAITIDSSESVLVGKSVDTLATSGTALFANGQIDSSVDGNYVAKFNRKSSDGTILELRKDTTNIVGSIDVDNGDNLTVQGKSDHSGLQFGTNAIFPHKNSANIDATIDLGEGSLRWKDIYLSGGLNFSANANNAGMSSETLDDYEEGTFTPFMRINNGVEGITYNGRVGSYTKIGNLVTCMIYMNLSSKGTNVGGVSIDGLPFTAGNNLGVVTSFNGNCLPAYFSSMATNISTLHGWVDDGTTEMYLRHTDGGGNSSTQNTNNGNINNNTDFRFFITYMV
jgi:hypothetical protein